MRVIHPFYSRERPDLSTVARRAKEEGRPYRKTVGTRSGGSVE